MRIVVLLRYPRVEKSVWKKAIIDGLIDRGDDVSLIFGASSYIQHIRAALKTYGPGFAKKKDEMASTAQPLLAGYFKTRSIRVFKHNDLNGRKTQMTLQKLQPDLILLLGTGIIRPPILEIPSLGAIHCHQGYLPDLRGVNTIEWSIFFGRDVYLTTHIVDPGVDTGRILLQKKVDLRAGDDIATIRRRCQFEAIKLILDTVDRVRNHTVHPQKQSREDGKQYFTMHPFFLDHVHQILNRRFSEVHD